MNSPISYKPCFGKYTYLLWGLFALLLSGCSGWIKPEQASVEDSVNLTSSQTVGQTFVAKYNGLAGIYFYLSPSSETGNGEITLHVRSSPGADTDLAISQRALPVEKIQSPGYYGFFIPSLADSNQKYYYVFLQLNGSGAVQVGNGSGNTYLNGALYINGSPAESQAAFQLVYARRQAFSGLGLEALSWAGILSLALFLFILPGWGVFSLLWPAWDRLTWLEKFGLSAGLSLALYPLLLLWTHTVGLHLGAGYAWIPPLAGLAMIIWRNRKQLTFRRFRPASLLSSTPDFLPNVVFLILIGLIVFSRFWAIRSLDLPMWGDSYQHTMIAQLIVNHGGLFSSWQPYADLTTFTYHFGFHSAVAVFNWLTHMDLPKAVLWVGQILNILSVASLYPLAVKIGRSRWAGVAAVLVAGLLSPMPMYYTNWGRYTQLAGQVILPTVAWGMWEVLASESTQKWTPHFDARLVIVCLALAGLALTHYRILILAMVLLTVLWALYARRDSIRSIIMNTFWLGLGSGVLFLPWFIRAFAGKMMAELTSQVSTSAAKAIEAEPQLTSLGNLSVYLPFFLWSFLVVAIAFGLWRRDKGILLVVVWWLGNFLLANPALFGLPGSGAISGFTVLIALYIPAALILGAAASWIVSNAQNFPNRRLKVGLLIPGLAAVFILGTGLWGVLRRYNELQPSQYAMSTRPDLLASEWIEENTPPDARILINSFSAFQDTVIVGSDGGWWLPMSAHRWITVPPLNYSLEKDPWPGYTVQTNSLTFQIRTRGIQDPSVLSTLINRDISYVYLGQLQGRVGSNGPLLTAAQLIADPAFHLVYHQDRVWIFRIQSME